MVGLWKREKNIFKQLLFLQTQSTGFKHHYHLTTPRCLILCHHIKEPKNFGRQLLTFICLSHLLGSIFSLKLLVSIGGSCDSIIKNGSLRKTVGKIISKHHSHLRKASRVSSQITEHIKTGIKKLRRILGKKKILGKSLKMLGVQPSCQKLLKNRFQCLPNLVQFKLRYIKNIFHNYKEFRKLLMLI